MPRPFTASQRNEVADRILEFIGDEPKTCREIAEHLTMNDKTAYNHLRFMAATLGILGCIKDSAAGVGRKPILWRKLEEGDEAQERRASAKVVYRDTWPRGEHKRDPLDVAFFGEVV